MSEPVGVGVVGCGVISEMYLKNMCGYESLDVVACADLDLARAKARAAQFGVPKACSVPELLADPAIDVVVNLTVPGAHAEVAQAAVEAGKSVYNEKPLTIERADARKLLETARERNVRVGGAPDTFLGGGLQTCRALVDAGRIGQPVAGTAFMLSHGPESWHPNPDFFYGYGGGPLLDMAPYYLTALINLVGSVRRVSGSARASFPERTITAKARAGQIIPVEIATHIAAVLDFADGTIATLVTSFDVWASETPKLELHGATASMSLPDPNTFGGPIRVRDAGAKEWDDVPVTRGFTEDSRGLGVKDMAEALRAGQPHRASGDLAYHVLDVMHSILDASRDGRAVELASTCERPAPLPV